MGKHRAGYLLTEPVVPNLGACCICGESGQHVRNVVMLKLRCPIPGRGWGCFPCQLPPDGANAVLCDGCLEDYRRGNEPLRDVCTGHYGSDGRTPIAQVTEPFDHKTGVHK